MTTLMLLSLATPLMASAGDSLHMKALLFPSCTTCQSHSEISLVAYLENEASDPVTIYGGLGWGELGGFVLHVEDASGKEVVPQALDDDMIVPTTLDDPNFYVTVQPDHGLGKRRTQSVKELFPHPGKYTVWVSYLSPVPGRLALPKDRFLARERGRISSDKITITVQ